MIINQNQNLIFINVLLHFRWLKSFVLLVDLSHASYEADVCIKQCIVFFSLIDLELNWDFIQETPTPNTKSTNILEWSPQLVHKKIPDGQREEGHGVVNHDQWEHHQSYLLHHYQNASIQDIQIQCRKDQMHVSHVEKNNVEQSSTVPNSQSIRGT